MAGSGVTHRLPWLADYAALIRITWYVCAMNWTDDQRPDDAMAGAFEAIGPEPVVTVGAAAFRDAMCRLGAAVHVVTTAGPGGKTGFTATAVCSVSDAPPTLLVCLNRRSQGGPILRENKVFCVNTLGADGQALADVFAGRTGAVNTQRFAAGSWATLKTGAPGLALARQNALNCAHAAKLRPAPVPPLRRSAGRSGVRLRSHRNHLFALLHPRLDDPGASPSQSVSDPVDCPRRRRDDVRDPGDPFRGAGRHHRTGHRRAWLPFPPGDDRGLGGNFHRRCRARTGRALRRGDLGAARARRRSGGAAGGP